MKNHLMVFVKVDNIIVDFLIKSLDWMIRLLIRTRIRQASSAVQKLTEAIAREPEKVYKRLEKSLRIPTSALKAFRAHFPGDRNKGGGAGKLRLTLGGMSSALDPVIPTRVMRAGAGRGTRTRSPGSINATEGR